MRLKTDSIDLYRSDFLLESITLLTVIALRSLPFLTFDVNHSGYENRLMRGNRQNKKMHASCGSRVS